MMVTVLVLLAPAAGGIFTSAEAVAGDAPS